MVALDLSLQFYASDFTPVHLLLTEYPEDANASQVLMAVITGLSIFPQIQLGLKSMHKFLGLAIKQIYKG